MGKNLGFSIVMGIDEVVECLKKNQAIHCAYIENVEEKFIGEEKNRLIRHAQKAVAALSVAIECVKQVHQSKPEADYAKN